MKRLALVLFLVAVSCSDEEPDGPRPTDAAADAARAAVEVDVGAEGGADGLAVDGSVDGLAVDGSVDGLADDGSFSVIVLPDTQFYSNYYPDFFDKQARWIVEQKNALKIAFVLHEGDIVDFDVRREWENAAHSLHMLDMQVPYVLAAGNHDIVVPTRQAALMNEYFPVSTFMAQPWFKGTFEPNQIQNNYQIFPVGGQMWLVLALEFGPRDEVLAWAKQILAQHPNTPAILVTHAYMFLYGQRYDHVKYSLSEQRWGPHDPVYALPGSSNDGEEMWQKLVSGAPNLKFVLSGHVPYPYSVSRISTQRPDGTHVHEMLANFQGCGSESPSCVDSMGKRTMGGWGYLRILRFEPSRHRVRVSTYSPVRNEYLKDPGNEFEVDLD